MFNLIHKTAIVTGGSSGIGKAISVALATQNATTYIIDVDVTNGNALAKELTAQGHKAWFIHCDVSDQAAVKGAFSKIIEASGTIDILINNAGISHIGQAHTTSEEDFDRLFKINVKGVYNCLHEGIPHMITGGGGAIVNLSSVAAVVGLADRFAYSMSKGAVQTMTYSVAKDYLDYGIRCNAVGPARIHTPFVDGFLKKNYPGKEAEMFDKLSKTQPIGRMGRPQEVANLVLYLVSDEASFITGSFYPIDGGFTTLNS